ncbi:MAG: hypothetical protein AB7I30_22910, partial [Isosphaeraceae bacterium]
PSGRTSEASHRIDEVLPTGDLRHRVVYSVVRAESGEPPVRLSASDPLVLIGLEGAVTVSEERPGESDSTSRQVVERGDVSVHWPGNPMQVVGAGRLGVLVWLNSLGHERRIRESRTSDRPISPEYEPESGRMGRE